MNKLISIIMITLVLIISGCATKTEPTMTFDEALQRMELDSEWNPQDPEILKLTDESGEMSLAFVLVTTTDWQTDNPEILKLRANDEITIAHMQVILKQWQTQNKEILMLTDVRGVSVAHALAAFTNWTTTDEDILSLTLIDDAKEISVEYVLKERMEQKGY